MPAAPRLARHDIPLRARRFAAALLFALVVPANAFAQFAIWSAAPQTPHPAVVRVTAPERDGASLGSGTLVDVSQSHGLVLTNWHVVRDAVGNVIVSFPDGFQSPGFVLKTDRDWDLAAVAVWKPHVSPVPIATQAPRPGDILTIAGYGPGNYRAISGPCTEYLSPGPNLPYEIVELHAAARHGDSGGPILNSRGELAGVLFGEGDGDTSGTYCGRVRLFLNSIGQGAAPMVASTAPLRIVPSPNNPLVNQANRAATAGSAVAGSWPRTTNFPPISLPIGTMSTPPGGSQSYATTLPPPPMPDGAPQESPLGPAQIDPHCAGPLAAIISPLPPMPPSPTANSTGGANASSTSGQPRTAQPADISWEQIAGHTFGDQLKTVLAGIGAIIVFLQVVRKLV
ncbi:MAG TPA: serine protease [Pirellulales bacterium]|nr:serine protease [Pirellulales bacterium]